MRRNIALMSALALVLSLTSCATQSQSKPSQPVAAAAPKAAADPRNPLSKVTVGMTKGQVREIAGSPSDENSYMTGKVFIPFYFGNDGRRTSWFYKGMGRVVFADGNAFGGGTAEVVRVDIDPTEAGIAGQRKE